MYISSFSTSAFGDKYFSFFKTLDFSDDVEDAKPDFFDFQSCSYSPGA